MLILMNVLCNFKTLFVSRLTFPEGVKNHFNYLAVFKAQFLLCVGATIQPTPKIWTNTTGNWCIN